MDDAGRARGADDATRFRVLFKATYSTVRRYAHHRGASGGHADDLVAETFLVAWRRLDDVPADDPVPWLLGVARNVWLNLRRGDRRRLALVRRLPPPEPVDPPADPVEPAELAALRAALDALDAGDQEILRLVGWDGLTPTQAAVVLGCSAGAARVRLHRARQRLTREMQKRSRPFGQDTFESQLIEEVSDDRA